MLLRLGKHCLARLPGKPRSAAGVGEIGTTLCWRKDGGLGEGPPDWTELPRGILRHEEATIQEGPPAELLE